MPTTTATLTAAIDQSLRQDDIITVIIGDDEDPLAVLAELYASPLCDDYDHTELTPTETDVWGMTPDGQTWRLYLRRQR